MNATWFGLLVFASVSFLVWGLFYLVTEVLLRYRSGVNERLKEITSTNVSSTVSPLFRKGMERALPLADASPTLTMRLNSILQGSGSQMSLSTAVKIALGLAAGLSVLAFAATRLWWTPIPAILCGLLMPLLWFIFKWRRRTHLLRKQLPDTFDLMSRAIKAGQTIPTAFQTVADDFEAPISVEFRHCYEEQNLGMPFETALRNLANRTGIIELQILVVALLVHGRCGGNLVELLQSLSGMVRKRQTLEARVKALTSEGRMQAIVLMVLPVAAFVAIWLIAPTYIASLLDRPWLILATLAAQGVGVLWIRRIVQIEF